MMTDKQYNAFFRSKLDNFSSDVPENVWLNIRNKKEQTHSRFIAGTRYFIVFLLLATTLRTTDMMTAGNKIMVLNSVKKEENRSSHIHTELQDKKNDLHDDTLYFSTINDNIKKKDLFVKSNNKKKKAWSLITNTDVSSDDNSNQSLLIETEVRRNDADTLNRESTLNNTNSKKDKKLLPRQADSTAEITINDDHHSDRLSVYLFASPDVSFAHVTSANSQYQQERNQQSQRQLSYSAGARFRINITGRLSANAGVQYSQVNEKIRMQSFKSDNHYRSIDVPLIAGYQLYKNKFEIDANAGIILNVNSSYKGFITSVSGEPVNIYQTRLYRHNTGISYYGGVQVLWQPSHTISLFAEPYFKYQPGNIVNSFQPFEEHIQKTGVLFGARYRFGNQ